MHHYMDEHLYKPAGQILARNGGWYIAEAQRCELLRGVSVRGGRLNAIADRAGIQRGPRRAKLKTSLYLGESQ
jgi:hypothetical protein